MSTGCEILGRFGAALELDWVPGALAEKAKLHLLDTLGVALSGEADPRRRDVGSIAAALHALRFGACVLRVHDVAATVQALRVWQGLIEIH